MNNINSIDTSSQMMFLITQDDCFLNYKQLTSNFEDD